MVLRTCEACQALQVSDPDRFGMIKDADKGVYKLYPLIETRRTIPMQSASAMQSSSLTSGSPPSVTPYCSATSYATVTSNQKDFLYPTTTRSSEATRSTIAYWLDALLCSTESWSRRTRPRQRHRHGLTHWIGAPSEFQSKTRSDVETTAMGPPTPIATWDDKHGDAKRDGIAHLLRDM